MEPHDIEHPNGIGLVDDALATGGWGAVGEIAWVLSPFLATVVINRLFGLFYLGPVAVLAAVTIARFLVSIGSTRRS